MKYTFYLAIFVATMIMMVSAAPNTRKVCHSVKDTHAHAVCKAYCGKSGYLLGECGTEGICICKKKSVAKKSTSSKKPVTTSKKAAKKAIKKTTKKVTTSKKH